MNNTITLSQLITRLAKATGVDNNTARRFLRTFFATVEETLEQGQSISIKGIGIFRRTDAELDNGRSSVAFVPDAAFLEELNRPFEMFEAVELADGVDFSEIEEPESVVEAEPYVEDAVLEIEKAESEPQLSSAPEPQSMQAPEAQAVSEPEPMPVSEAAVTDVSAQMPTESASVSAAKDKGLADSAVSATTPTTPRRPMIVEHDPIVIQPRGAVPSSDGDDEPEETVSPVSGRNGHRPSRLWIWSALFLGVACILGYFAAVWVVPMPETDYGDDEDTVMDEAAAPDSAVAVEEVSVEELVSAPSQETPAVASPEPAQEVPTVVSSPEPVYDTVSISLIKLAKKHYGIGDYWVFIFDANRDIIKNPNAIRPGTKVRIPDRSELPGKDAAETKAIARKKSAEYLAAY